VSFLILCVLTLGGLAWYVLEPVERAEVIRGVMARLRQVLDLARRMRRGREPLHDVLRARTPFALVTPALAAGYLAVFIGLLFGSAPPDDPATLVSWGASFGPRTTNGEWWRLGTSTMVHSGVLHLAVNLAALLSVGLVLERLVGHVTFTAAYLTAAVFAGVSSLSASSVSVVAGGSAAIFGLYGLLLASWTWGAFQHAATTIRLRTVARLTPAATAFVLYHIADDGGLSAAQQVGLATGFACGLVLARCVGQTKPPARRIAATAAVAASIAIMTAVPLRGVVDVRPEVERLIALEARLTDTYDAAVRELTEGRVARQALAELIDGVMLPELQEARVRIEAFGRVPPEHQPLLDAAGRYLRLRDEGWRVRATALRQSSAPMLREADKLEKASRTALQGVRPRP
jgi:rhomboid protease GluP